MTGVSPAQHPAGIWRRVWSRVCRHSDGVAIGSTVAILAERGVLDFLVRQGPASMGEIRQRFGGNPGYLHVAFRLLACQGWLQRQGEPGTEAMELALTPAGRMVARLAPFYARAVACLPQARDLASALCEKGGEGGSHFVGLSRHLERSWDLPPSPVTPQVLHHLNGHVVAPVMAALALRNALPTRPGPWSLDPERTGGPAQALQEALRILLTLGWAEMRGSSVEATEEGAMVATLARQYWYPVGYLTTLLQVPDLLFGDPAVRYRQSAAGEETHVDRRLDIRFSGGVFAKSCREPFLEMALPLFDRSPIEEQPRAVVDTGSGDGSLLRALYGGVRDRTLRGPRLAEHPLTMVGVEPSAVAREATARTLSEAGIPYRVLAGDIADPDGIARGLRGLGIDPLDALHVSKSVIHNRTYREPEDPGPGQSSQSQAAFAAPDGSAIPNALLERNLVEHFRRWRKLGRRHGLLVIEAHTVDPKMTARLLGRTMVTVLDATHGYSNQYPVEPEVFREAAREAGLASREHRELGREALGHTALTLDYFVAA